MSFGGFDVIQEPASTLVSPSSSPRRRPGESLKGQFDGIGLSELSYKNGTDASDAPFSRAVHMNPSPVNSIHRDVEGHQPGIAVTREVVTTVEHNVDHRIGRSSSEEDLELGQGEHRENHRSDTP